jgi:hypothetical protein
MTEAAPITDPVQCQRELNKWNRSARKELKAMGADPLSQLADRIDRFVETQPEIVDELAHWRPIDRVPYSVHDLPPEAEPFIPSSEGELEAYLDSFMQIHQRLHASTPGFHVEATSFPAYRENLAATLRRRREDGTQVDPYHWQQYQAVYKAQLARGFFTLGDNAAAIMRLRASGSAEKRGIFKYMAGQYESYLLMSMGSPKVGLYLRVPVPKGDLGLISAERLIRAGSFIYDFIALDQEFTDQLKRETEKHHDVVFQRTLRGKNSQGRYNSIEALIISSQEGIGSIIGSAACIAGDREDFDQVMTQLVKGDLVNQLALYVTVGVCGAVTAFGRYFLDPTQNVGKRLTLSPTMLTDVRSIRERSAGIVHTQWTKWLNHLVEVQKNGEDSSPPGNPPDWTNLPCPHAGPYRSPQGDHLSPGAITRFTQTLGHVYSCITPRPSYPGHQSSPWEPPSFIPGQT